MMKFNMIDTGIELIGSTIKSMAVENNIVDVDRHVKRSFGLNINEPSIESFNDGFLSQMTIDFEVEIEQSEGQQFKLELSLEGAFLSHGEMDESAFKQLVAINGAAAIIGIARGKIESITANIFNNGKITIPFVNVVEYYRDVMEG